MATVNITASAVSKFIYDPHGPARQFLWDAKVPGFAVRVYPSGRQSYVINYRIGARTPLMSIGNVADFKNVGQARTRADELLRRFRREGIDPLAERRRQRAAGTTSTLLDQWLAAATKKCSPRTVKDYRLYVTGYLIPEFGTRKPTEVTKGDCQRLHARFTENRGPSIANHVLRALHSCYSWALKQDSDTFPDGFVNPVIVEWNKERSREEFIRPDELPALTNAIEVETDPWVKAFLWLLLLTAARSGELQNLQWDQVSLSDGELILRKTKNGTDHKLRLSGAAVDILRALPHTGSAYVFPRRRSDGKVPHMAKPRRAWKAALKRAGIKRNVTLHDTRRTAGVLLSSKGFTAEQIARQLNHKSNITAKTYIRIAEDIQKVMADVMGRAAKSLPEVATEATPLPVVVHAEGGLKALR
jgi:integrase